MTTDVTTQDIFIKSDESRLILILCTYNTFLTAQKKQEHNHEVGYCYSNFTYVPFRSTNNKRMDSLQMQCMLDIGTRFIIRFPFFSSSVIVELQVNTIWFISSDSKMTSKSIQIQVL